MKVKFLKDYKNYKAEQEVEIEDSDLAEAYIAKGHASAVVEDTEVDNVRKIVETLVADATAEGYKKGLEKGAEELKKAVGKARPQIVVGPDNLESHPTKGFKNFGEFASSIRKACTGASLDERLRYTKTGLGSGMNEGDGTATDGSYVVPTEYANQIFAIIMGEDRLMPRCFNMPTQTAHVKLPIDNLTTIGTNAISGGFVAADGVQATPTGQAFVEQLSFDLHKYISLIPVTDELLKDNNVALESYLVTKAGYDLDYKVNHGIVQGITNGATGWLSSSQLSTNGGPTLVVTPDVEDEYIAETNGISYHDIATMKAHHYPTPRATQQSVCWVINWLLEEDLITLKDDLGRLIYFAPGGLGAQPYPTLLGIPVVKSFHASARGSIGDISLVDLSAYVNITESAGVQAATSIHLYFDRDITAFRFTFRTDGKPGLLKPLTLPDGSGQQVSPFVTLGTRS